MEDPLSPMADIPFGQVDLVCVVPLWPARERERGFNQVADLAAPVADAIGRPLDAGLLHRTRETRPQPGLGPAERRANVDGAFRAVPGRHPVRRARMLLVDDLITTGATVAACATALRAAGAARVWAVALAHSVFLGDDGL
jgi:predicted amidophosphoribosyltransferase